MGFKFSAQISPLGCVVFGKLDTQFLGPLTIVGVEFVTKIGFRKYFTRSSFLKLLWIEGMIYINNSEKFSSRKSK